jgi:hypothetical protein
MTSNVEFNNIIEFNDYISNNNIDYDINKYFTKIHEIFNNNVDISFMEYFLSLIEKKDEFCVQHQKLIEYGIIKEKKDNSHIKDCITNKNFEFKENIDYIGLTERSGKPKGGRPGIVYKMKPHVFKMCLMRSKNENKYAKYFLNLEECFYYYKDYQIKYQKNIINGISKENKDLHYKIDKQSNDIKELLKFAKDTNEKLTDANDNINDMQNDIDHLTDEVKETNEKVEEVREEFKKQREHINPPPENDNDIHMLVLLQYPNETDKLRIIRGQNKHLDKKITQDMNIIIDKKYHPNPIDAFTILKDEIRKLNKEAKDKIRSDFKNKTISRDEKNDLLEDHRDFPAIMIKYNTIHLNYKKITLNEFIELVNKCTDLGKKTYVP